MMVNRAICEECNNRIDYLSRDGPIRCDCGDEMEFAGKVGCVRGLSEGQTANDDLQDLIDEWLEYASQYGHHQTDTFNARCETWESAADQLEDIVTEESDR
ncbi:hypothetical protein [Natronosalvus halobius]|uniref:hypothetical protein n=1 Tax=Natronosalvus halobius TaxID=2953746 RepID=UPI00209F0995|nr:hypothetical protein [Natronosalvus halobius]USZ73754.1 hypothetical protein NGM15_18630 [Natronosalvus halobius]